MDVESREELKQRLRALLEARPEIQFAYLHGSFAEEGLPYHDVDVALYLEPAQAAVLDLFDYAMELSTDLTLQFHVPVDVQMLNEAPLDFQHSVFQGELLFARDEEAMMDLLEQVAWEFMQFEHHWRESLRDLLLWDTQ